MKVLDVLLLVLFASSASAAGSGIENGNDRGIPVDAAGDDIPAKAAGGVIPDEYLVMHDGDINARGLLNGLIKSDRAEIPQEYTIINAFAGRMKLDAL